jgi:hypothetical protein
MSPRKTKKKASEMTDAELLQRVFPKKALDELKRIARDAENPKRQKKS